MNCKPKASVNEVNTFGFQVYLTSVGVEHKLISAYYPESNGKAEAFIKILSAECLPMKEFADAEKLEAFIARFITYYNQYRAHGGLGYKPPVYWYAGACPKVRGLGGIPGLEAIAQEWSGDSMAEPPIVVNNEVLARSKALAPIS